MRRGRAHVILYHIKYQGKERVELSIYYIFATCISHRLVTEENAFATNVKILVDVNEVRLGVMAQCHPHLTNYTSHRANPNPNKDIAVGSNHHVA